jgi:hypothetical protein
MDEKNREIIASNLTAAFYAGVERRVPYFGEERRSILNSPMGDDRIPSLSPNEVFHVYSRFLHLLGEEEQQNRR